LIALDFTDGLEAVSLRGLRELRRSVRRPQRLEQLQHDDIAGSGRHSRNALGLHRRAGAHDGDGDDRRPRFGKDRPGGEHRPLVDEDAQTERGLGTQGFDPDHEIPGRACVRAGRNAWFGLGHDRTVPPGTDRIKDWS